MRGPVGHQNEHAEWLMDAVEAVTAVACSAAPPEQQLRSACAAIVDHANAAGAWVLMAQEGHLSVLSGEAGDEALEALVQIPRSRETYYQTLARHVATVLNAGGKEPADFDGATGAATIIQREILMGQAAYDLACVPLLRGEGVIGALACLFPATPSRSAQELRDLRLVGRVVAMAAATVNGPLPVAGDNARLQALLPGLAGTFFVINQRGSIVDVKHGVSPVDLAKRATGGYAYDFQSDHFAESHEQAVRRGLAGETATCHIHLPAVGDGHHGARIIEERLMPVLSPHGHTMEVVGFARDVTEELRLREALREIQEHDRLTDCLTFDALRMRARSEIEHAQRHRVTLCFFSIEIDKNATGSHLMGQDAFGGLLQTVAGRIRRQLPRINMLARRSEHSFVAIAQLPAAHTSDAAALTLCTSIITALREPVITGRFEHFLNVSIGVALSPRDGDSAENLFAHADIAALHAQQAGRNQALVFGTGMAAVVTERLQLETRLHRAVDNEEFSLVFQPKVNLLDGSVSGVEALLRWINQKDVGPAQFIPIAEECGLITYIGEWVLRQACITAHRWARHGQRIPIAVNVSTRQLRDNNFHLIVKEVLEETGCDPALIELEVTEGVMLTNPAAAILSFSAMRDLGVSLSIDDFGTGFSNMSYLKSLPVNTIKIDRAFVRGLPDDPENAAISSAIVAMAKAMRMKVVAEGVEDLGSVKFLQQLRCDQVQGYYFSKPMVEADFLSWYRAYQLLAA